MSIASQATQQKFPFSYEAVFAGLVDAIANSGMSIKSQDKVIGRVTASAGMSLMSWGENLTIIVEKIDENSTIVGIESSLKFGANLAGAHRHQKNFNRIISSLSSILQERKVVKTNAASLNDDLKKCPFCAESIKTEAVICRFCNRDVPTFGEADEAVTKETEGFSEHQKALDIKNGTTVGSNEALNYKSKFKTYAWLIGVILIIAMIFISVKKSEQNDIEVKKQQDIEYRENCSRWLKSAKILIESNGLVDWELSSAKTSLESINSSMPEYKEAQELLPVITKRMADVKEGKTEQELFTLGGKRIHARHPNWSANVCNTIAKKQINIGMTTEQVAAAWGRPYHINKTTGS